MADCAGLENQNPKGSGVNFAEYARRDAARSKYLAERLATLRPGDVAPYYWGLRRPELKHSLFLAIEELEEVARS